MTEQSEPVTPAEPMPPAEQAQVTVPPLSGPTAETVVQQVNAPVVEADTSAQDVIDRAADQVEAAKTERPISLRERISAAETIEALDALMDEGASDKYKFAANKTRNRWKAAAKKRRVELGG